MWLVARTLSIRHKPCCGQTDRHSHRHCLTIRVAYNWQRREPITSLVTTTRTAIRNSPVSAVDRYIRWHQNVTGVLCLRTLLSSTPRNRSKVKRVTLPISSFYSPTSNVRRYNSTYIVSNHIMSKYFVKAHFTPQYLMQLASGPPLYLTSVDHTRLGSIEFVRERKSMRCAAVWDKLS